MTNPVKEKNAEQPSLPGAPAQTRHPSVGGRNAKPKSSSVSCAAKRSTPSADRPPCPSLDWKSGGPKRWAASKGRSKSVRLMIPPNSGLMRPTGASANSAWRSNCCAPGAKSRALLPDGGRAHERGHLPSRRSGLWDPTRVCRVGFPALQLLRTKSRDACRPPSPWANAVQKPPSMIPRCWP